MTGRVRFVLARLVWSVGTLCVVALFIFIATEVLPGDAAAQLAGPTATPVEVAQLRHQLGLDRPAPVRFLEWAGGAIRGDLGVSLTSGTPVDQVIATRLPNSIVLTLAAFALATPAAIAAGLWAGVREGRMADRMINVVGLLMIALPEFVTTVALSIVFSQWLGWFPQVGLVRIGGTPWDAPAGMVLPVLSLALFGFAVAARTLRARVIQVMGVPSVEAARLRGVGDWGLAWRHVLPNAVQPAVQVIAIMFGGLIGGSVVVELVFNYPGVGYELQQAVGRRDLPVVQGIGLTLCAIALAVLWIGDLVVALLDPRAWSSDD
ncbi:MAG: ABC transporter permease [Acidipropionibacterium sp.]|jgi:peptide/nickel transport system permease protein|nr:ABC transporter permease [Acidipropionibacterium sp.]